MNLYGMKFLPLLGWVYNLCTGLEDNYFCLRIARSQLPEVLPNRLMEIALENLSQRQPAKLYLDS